MQPLFNPSTHRNQAQTKPKLNKKIHKPNTSTVSKNKQNTIQSDISSRNEINDINNASKKFDFNGVYPANELLHNNNDQEKINNCMHKNMCSTTIARVHGVYTEILIDTGAELSVKIRNF